MDMTMKRNQAATAISVLSVVLYLLSLVLPAYKTDAQEHLGIEAFLLGPIGFFAGHYSWIANPVLWFAWAKSGGEDVDLSSALALVAFMVALSFLLGNKIAVGSAGEYEYKTAIGYYVWLASMAACAVAARVFNPLQARVSSVENEPSQETPPK